MPTSYRNNGDFMNFQEGKTNYLASSGCNIELLITGSEHFYKDVILVCFSGAVSNRDKKNYPFFSGVGVSKKLNLTCVSITDYTLSLSNDLGLAWYAGHSENKIYQTDIAEFIDTLPLSKKVIVFGGSGGGFAALAIASTINRPLDIFIWNPQTSITQYDSGSVFKYIATSFPQVWKEKIEPIKLFSDRKEAIRIFLSSVGIIHDLNNVSYSKNKRIIYFQNQTDRHLQVHAIPFIESNGYKDKILKGVRLLKLNKNWYFYIGFWGKGHTGPPVELINKVINFLAYRRNELHLITTQLELQKTSINLVNGNIFNNIKTSIQLHSDQGVRSIRLSMESLSDNLNFEEFRFAFYVIINGEVAFKRWYTDKNFFETEISPDLEGDISGQYFIRDVYSDYISFKSQVFKL